MKKNCFWIMFFCISFIVLQASEEGCNVAEQENQVTAFDENPLGLSFGNKEIKVFDLSDSFNVTSPSSFRSNVSSDSQKSAFSEMQDSIRRNPRFQSLRLISPRSQQSSPEDQLSILSSPVRPKKQQVSPAVRASSDASVVCIREKNKSEAELQKLEVRKQRIKEHYGNLISSISLRKNDPKKSKKAEENKTLICGAATCCCLVTTAVVTGVFVAVGYVHL